MADFYQTGAVNYPVAHPHLGLEFCKGFYARVTDHMHGRGTRLFITPLIRAIQSMGIDAQFLNFLDGFRYPLAAELAMDIRRPNWNRVLAACPEFFDLLLDAVTRDAKQSECQAA